VPFPDGVATPDGRVGFLELRDGGVLALELATGRELWRLPVAARPRLLAGDRLIAEDRQRSRGNVLQLLTIDLAAQRLIRPFEAIVLPEWVSVDDPDREFEYTLWGEGSEAVVEWRAVSHYAGGAPPPAHVEGRERRAARGRVRVNLASGRVEDDGQTTVPITDMAAFPTDSQRVSSPLVPANARVAAVVGEQLFYIVEPAPRSGDGPRLVSVDVDTGSERWAVALPARPRAGPPARRM
jgi:hypothetical protein